MVGAMSSMIRPNARSIGEDGCSRIVRRMVSLPRSIIGGVSRAMGHGIDLIGIAGGRHQHMVQPNFQLPHPQEPSVTPDEWVFLDSFELQYGSTHPFFYVCQFMEARKMAEDEHKFMFMYLHSPDHPFTPSFCRETLGSEVVVQFLDANFVCWGALADRGEGVQMVTTLQPASFPFCAVIAPASGDNMAVLQQMEGPISPAELVEILQRTMEEQGLAYGSGRAKEEEKRMGDRRLREEQDAAYLAALQIDREKDRLQNSPSEKKVDKPASSSNKANYEKLKQYPNKKQYGKVRETAIPTSATPATTATREARDKDFTGKGRDAHNTQILIRFPNGERRERSFSCSEKIQSIYRYIDSLGLPGVANYRLISSFPRRVYGVDQMGMTLNDAGLHPRASLFLELL